MPPANSTLDAQEAVSDLHRDTGTRVDFLSIFLGMSGILGVVASN